MAKIAWLNLTAIAAGLTVLSQTIVESDRSLGQLPLAKADSSQLWLAPRPAMATTSGGRARGGSFGRDSGSSGSSNRSSGRSSSRDDSSFSSDSSNRSRSSSGSSSGSPADWLFMFGVFAAMAVILAAQGASNLASAVREMRPLLLEAQKAGGLSAGGKGGQLSPLLSQLQDQARQLDAQSRGGLSTNVSGEIDNNIVAVTFVQVAMLAQAREVQQDLNQMVAITDLGTPAGLMRALQETVLAMSRVSHSWSHALVHSHTVPSRQQAGQAFERLSMEERSKFDVESLTNIDGEIKTQDIIQRDEDPASYIVVTLIVGSAHDQPLVTEPVLSPDDLRSLLLKLGAITDDYLMVYELLWSPQNESDSLTRDELLLHYPDMTQIA